MQRDMDLIRKILAAIKAKDNLSPRPLKIDGYDDLLVNRHVEMLVHADFIEGSVKHSSSDHSVYCLVRDLTMDGHDFAAVIENDTVWARLKKSWSPEELARVPLSVVQTLGMDVLTEYLKGKIGLP